MATKTVPQERTSGLIFENIAEIETTTSVQRANELLAGGWVLLNVGQLTGAAPMSPPRDKANGAAPGKKAISGEPGMYVKRFFGFVLGRPRA